jgi:hypothetical protein
MSSHLNNKIPKQDNHLESPKQRWKTFVLSLLLLGGLSFVQPVLAGRDYTYFALFSRWAFLWW